MPQSQFGFTLFEVLVSLVLLSLILLALDAMQLMALRSARASYLSHVALLRLDVLRERLQLLNSEQGVGAEVAAWQQMNQQVLPQGYGEVRGDFPIYTATIFWGKQSHTACKIELLNCLEMQIYI